MKVKVAKWGNSLGVRLPKAAVEAVGAADGTDLELVVEGRALRLISPPRTSRDLMQEMLDQIDRLGPGCVSETVDWGPDRGSEIIDDAYSRGEITLDDILKRKSTKTATSRRGKSDARSRHR